MLLRPNFPRQQAGKVDARGNIHDLGRGVIPLELGKGQRIRGGS